MLGELFGVVAPVMFLALVGFVWARRGVEYDIAFVTRMAMDVGVPALIVSTFARVEIDPAAFRAVAMASAAFYVALAVVGWFAIKLWRGSQRALLSPFTFGNTGNLGLPLALFAFGDAGLAYALAIFATMAVLNFTFGVWLVSGEASPSRALRQPLVYASLLGGALAYWNIDLPEWLQRTLELAGQTAIPLMLITLGVAVARLAAKAAGPLLALAAIKLIASIALALLMAQLFGVTGEARAALVLQGATPVAVTSYLLAERFKADPQQVAAFVVMSTLLCAFALPPLIGALMQGAL